MAVLLFALTPQIQGNEEQLGSTAFLWRFPAARLTVASPWCSV